MRWRVRFTRIGLALSLLTLVAASPPQPAAEAVGPVAITVADLRRSVAFYTNVLEFKEESENEVASPQIDELEGVRGLRLRIAHLALGDERIELMQYLAPKGRAFPADSRANDRWFQHIAIVTSNMNAAYARLRAYHVRNASTGPQRLPDWNKNAGGIRAFYFRDPDGHYLELLHFPPDKGRAKWHTGKGRLFMGIDHTAIVVSNTGQSLRFYRDMLGMRIVGTSENYGKEQEHLNNVPGAHLRITSLRAQDGPGIELLEYLSPRDGRPAPANERANDLVHWQTTIICTNVDSEITLLAKAHVPLISGGVVGAPIADIAEGAVVSDPDGHAMELVQP
ncbi:MAG: VOC family protein [Candidatus Eremiobacteraeota bacterium]|nr:VOC family protein [Candidatus Eremiobacteraeota bacterium]